MNLVRTETCPVSGEAGKVKIASATDAFFGTEGNWRYRANARTGHLWLDPRPADDDVGALYSEYYTHAECAPQATSTWQQAQALALSRRLGYPYPSESRLAARVVSRLPSVADAAELTVMRVPFSQVGTLLDVGCGSGEFLQRMRDTGWRVLGTEPDPNAAARLQDRLGFRVFSNVGEVEAQPERFDLITLSHVIEHVPDPLATLRQLARLLKPGGRLVITTPNAKGFGASLFGRFWRGLEPPRHFNVFTPESLSEALVGAGLRVETLRTEVRLARGIFYLSAMACSGKRQLESRRPPQKRWLTFAGYAFQIFEAAAVRLFPGAGEEIYCGATSAGPASRPAE